MFIVDAHEDLAWNMLAFGRDYTRSAAETRAAEQNTDIPGQVGQALLGWPDWIRGEIGLIFGALYASVASDRSCCRHSQVYRTGEEAHHIFQAQLRAYHRLVENHPDKFYLVKTRSELEAGLTAWRTAPPAARRVGLVLLIEGAEGVRRPEELSDWFAAGVRILGPAWATTRYARGAGRSGGFTPAGRALLREMARLGMILDLSHLNDEGAAEAIAEYPGPIIASHSNARRLLPTTNPLRHLSDSMIRRLAARQGVIGVALFNNFLRDGVACGAPREPVTLDDVVAHIDHFADLAGHTRHIGLGSDFDGGFGLENIPTGLNSIADLGRIGEALDKRGYSAQAVAGILGENWLRLLRQTLPES